MDTRTFLLQIRQKRSAMLTIATVAFFATAGYVYFFVEHGRAEIGIKIVTTPVIRTGDNVDIYRNIFQASELVEKERLMIYSDEMIAHLCKRFNLYKYYDVNPDNEYAFERITHIVTQRFGFDKKTMDVMVVSYADRDARMATNLLNEMVSKLDEMNRDAINEMIAANAEVYGDVQQSLVSRIEMQQTSLKTTLEQLDSITHSPQSKSSNDVFGKQLTMYRETVELNSLKDQSTAAYNNYKVAENTITKSHQPLVRVMSKPIPSNGRKNLITLGCGLTAGFIAILLYGMFYYYRDEYEWELKTLFGK